MIESSKKGGAGGLRRRITRAYFRNLKKINTVMAILGLVLGIYFIRVGNYLLSALMFLGMVGYLYGATSDTRRTRRPPTRAERRRKMRK